jgi:beta-glucosidase
MTFPDGFLWGAATAAHQVEGANVNSDNWVLEHTPGTIYVESSGDACDHLHRYPDDIALLASLGLGAYRFSIEWARIEPEEDEFSHATLDHYRRVLETCHAHGVTPMVTFHHFTSPRWLAADGGWEGERTPERFARFCEVAMTHLGDLIPLAITLNEPNIGSLLNYVIGIPDPRGADWWRAAAATVGATPERFLPMAHAATERSCEISRTAHRLALEAIKGVRGDCQVGLSIAMHQWEAVDGGEAKLAELRHLAEDRFIEDIEGDFVGVQCYTGVRIGADGPLDVEGERTMMGYADQPQALEHAIRHAIEVTGLPAFVTENGIATSDDARRIDYLQRALEGVAACLDDGLDVRGYFHWSLLDNFEWVMGYRPTFGLVAVDRETLQRTPRPSASRFGEIARTNATDISTRR